VSSKNAILAGAPHRSPGISKPSVNPPEEKKMHILFTKIAIVAFPGLHTRGRYRVTQEMHKDQLQRHRVRSAPSISRNRAEPADQPEWR
jgi:hypothetical protein